MAQYEKIVVVGFGDVGHTAVAVADSIDGVKWVKHPEHLPIADCLVQPIADSLAETNMLFLATDPREACVAEAIAYANIARKMGILTFGFALIQAKQCLSLSDDILCYMPLDYNMEDAREFKEAVDAIMPGLFLAQTKETVRFMSDLLNRPGYVNLDFQDISAILSNAGYAITGSGVGQGENRAEEAARNALQSLSEYATRNGLHSLAKLAAADCVKGILMSITSGPDVRLTELANAAEIIKDSAGPDARVVWAHVLNENAGECVYVNLLATKSPPCVSLGRYLSYKYMLRSESIEELSERLDNGFNVYQKDENLRSFFEAAIRWGTPEFVKLCVEKGADPNVIELGGERGSALKAAIDENNFNTLRALIEAGADVNAKDQHGRVALGIALDSAEEHKELALLLDRLMGVMLDAGADLSLLNVHEISMMRECPEEHHAMTDNELCDELFFRAIEKYDIERVRELSQKIRRDIRKELAFDLEYVSNVFPEGDGDEEASERKHKLDAGAKILRLLHDAGFNVPIRGPRGQELTYGLARTYVRNPDDCGEVIVPDDDFTALTYAVSPLALKALIDSGADVNARNENGDATLTFILRHPYLYFHADKMVEMLVNAGVETDISSLPYIYDAVTEGRAGTLYHNNIVDAKIILTLFKSGRMKALDAKVNEPLQLRETPGTSTKANLVRSLWNAIETAFLLEPKPECLPQKDVELMIAAVHGDEKDIMRSLSGGANVNARAQNGYTPLMFAAVLNFKTHEAVRTLIENGADVNARDFRHDTALSLAAKSDPKYPKVIQALAEAGADVNEVYDHGSTPLMLAAENSFRDSEVVAELIDAGADVNAKRKDGECALTLAAKAKHFRVIRSLLAAGADPRRAF